MNDNFNEIMDKGADFMLQFKQLILDHRPELSYLEIGALTIGFIVTMTEFLKGSEKTKLMLEMQAQLCGKMPRVDITEEQFDEYLKDMIGTSKILH